MPDLSVPGVSFAEAIAYLRARLRLSEAEFRDIEAKAGSAAAKIASATTEAMRYELLQAVLDAMEKGKTAATFRDDYERITQSYGWKAEGKDPGWHSDLIFRVETSKAVAAGRWEQVQRVKTLRPYLRYVTMDDQRVRPEHALWHGIVLPVDHPFWQTHWPPNGFNCRCTVQSLNERDLARYGVALTAEADPRLAVAPDPGWSGNEGIAWEQMRARG